MKKHTVARIWFSMLIVSVIFAIPTRCILSGADETGEFVESWARAGNTLLYFTIMTNALAAFVSYRYLRRVDGQKPLEKIMRIDALVCIIVVAVIYWALIYPTDHPEG